MELSGLRPTSGEQHIGHFTVPDIVVANSIVQMVELGYEGDDIGELKVDSLTEHFLVATFLGKAGDDFMNWNGVQDVVELVDQELPVGVLSINASIA